MKMIADIEGINDLSMTTNGVLLKQFAWELHSAGLQRVNISLDTVDPERFKYITRSGNLKMCLKELKLQKMQASIR